MSQTLKLIDLRRNGNYNSMEAPLGNLGIPRQNMPQIDSQFRNDFISWLKKQHLQVRNIRVPIRSLSLTQSEYDRDKVSAMIDQMKNGSKKMPPIFVSSDGYVLDGSHRLIAQLNMPGVKYMEVTEIGMKMTDLLKLVETYPHCRYRSLQDKPR